ncbi:hypothetical protein C8R43DRAFT_1137959 [Mycena crocata]|nr:hypothetical protein C8R43DRAFT_1137959 [Mycena crocata]
MTQGEPNGPQNKFVSINGTPLPVAALTVADFCAEYGLGEEIEKALKAEGFETAGALLEISWDDPTLAATFKRGHVAEVKRAVKEYTFRIINDNEKSSA